MRCWVCRAIFNNPRLSSRLCHAIMRGRHQKLSACFNTISSAGIDAAPPSPAQMLRGNDGTKDDIHGKPGGAATFTPSNGGDGGRIEVYTSLYDGNMYNRVRGGDGSYAQVGINALECLCKGTHFACTCSLAACEPVSCCPKCTTVAATYCEDFHARVNPTALAQGQRLTGCKRSIDSRPTHPFPLLQIGGDGGNGATPNGISHAGCYGGSVSWEGCTSWHSVWCGGSCNQWEWSGELCWHSISRAIHQGHSDNHFS